MKHNVSNWNENSKLYLHLAYDASQAKYQKVFFLWRHECLQNYEQRKADSFVKFSLEKNSVIDLFKNQKKFPWGNDILKLFGPKLQICDCSKRTFLLKELFFVCSHIAFQNRVFYDPAKLFVLTFWYLKQAIRFSLSQWFPTFFWSRTHNRKTQILRIP
jgi:hypothetical protein